jgi:hypothetical protein
MEGRRLVTLTFMGRLEVDRRMFPLPWGLAPDARMDCSALLSSGSVEARHQEWL